VADPKGRPGKPAPPKTGSTRKVTEARLNAAYEKDMRRRGPNTTTPNQRATTRRRAI
jgi:hypothetical protein